ncbi:MAG: arsenosugar biosynthesis radical SAM (seleno)protein ArsS [Pseudomonadota bacterium]
MLTEETTRETTAVSLKAFAGIPPFSLNLSKRGLKLNRDKTRILQVNLGFLCNQACRHCHLNAGPARKENMESGIVDEVIDYARRSRFETIDITGGAPELNPNIEKLIEGTAHRVTRVMLRSNLSALNDGSRDHLPELLKSFKVVIVASFPSLNALQSNSQRGDGIFEISIDALKKLNAIGYGRGGSGLELNLVSNPTGAFLPPSQAETEKRFRRVLKNKWGVVFNNLYNFANVPLGRYRQWLVRSGNFDRYMGKLHSSFNPCAVDNVMCRTLVSVSWDGYLYDCDFNLAKGIFMGGRKIHISEMPGPPEPEGHIATADHCYTCTAGPGFT